MEIKNRVRELRARHNFTQGELADVVDVTRQTIVAFEKGNYVPSLMLAMKISRIFKLPIEEIFYWEDDEV